MAESLEAPSAPELSSPVSPPAAQPRIAHPGPFRLTTPEPPPAGRPSPRYRVPWAELLRRVFAIDVLECPSCAGRIEIIAFIAQAAVAKRILDHLGMDSQAPPLSRARAPDDTGSTDDPGAGHGTDPAYEE